MSEAAVLEKVDCVEGVEVERTSSGRIRYVRIDLDTHPFVGDILEERGLVNGKDLEPFGPDLKYLEEEDDSWLIPTPAVEVDCRNIKWSKSMLQAFEDKKNGRYRPLNLENFWNV